MTVDQWVLEYVRAQQAVFAAVGNKVYLYQVPAEVSQPYLHIQLVSGLRDPKTQTLRTAGSTRFQLDLYEKDRFQARTAIEAIMRAVIVSNVLTSGLRIEQSEVSGPRMLPSVEGYRFSCDLRITWVEEE
jgi:hypothetical protein